MTINEEAGATNLDREQGGGRTDECLLNAVRSGDQAAFAELYNRYFPAADKFARRLLGSAQGADGLVSESFAKC